MYRSRRKQLAYDKMARIPGCAFCQLDDRALNPQPRTIVQKTAYMMVTANSFPYEFWEQLHIAEHLLLVPIRHVTTMDGLTPEERKDFIDLMCAYESQGYSVYSRSPDNIIRSVAHIHTHLIKTSGKKPKVWLTLKKPYLLARW